jgi:hypothetical protein
LASLITAIGDWTTCSTFIGPTGGAGFESPFKLDRAEGSSGACFAAAVEPLVFSTAGSSTVWLCPSFVSSSLSSGSAFSITGTSSFLDASSTFLGTVVSPTFPSLGSSALDCAPSPAFPTGMKFDLTRVLNPFPPKGGPASVCSGFTNARPPCCSKKALSEETCRQRR